MVYDFQLWKHVKKVPIKGVIEVKMIEFSNITLGFGNKIIFDDFNYSIESGKKILLNSPSGTGKSTLFGLMLGFLKPEKGQVIVDNLVLNAGTIKEIRNKYGYLSQDIEFGEGKVLYIIREIFNYAQNRGVQLNLNLLNNLMDYFEIESSLLENSARSLSGGEKQRLMIIILLLLNKDIYLLDEPTSALDESLKSKVKEYFLGMQKTVFVISHDKLWEKDKRVTILNWQGKVGNIYGQ